MFADYLLGPNPIDNAPSSSKVPMTFLSESLSHNDDIKRKAVPGSESAQLVGTDLTGTGVNINLLQGNLLNNIDSLRREDENSVFPFSLDKLFESNDSNPPPVSIVEALTDYDRRYSSTNTQQSPPPPPSHVYNPNDISNASVTPRQYIGMKSLTIQGLEKELNSLTAEYTNLYNIYTSDIMTRNQFLQSNAEYLNKFVKDISASDPSGAYYYINKFGYTHKYNKESIDQNDASGCPSIPKTGNPATINDALVLNVRGLNTFKDYVGPSMNPEQPCLAAVNIQKEGTQQYAWVDTKGYKHLYQEGIWPDRRDSSCKRENVGDVIVLRATKFDAIPTDTANPMSSSSVCYKMNIDASLYQRLIDLNARINRVTANISKETKDIADASVQLEGDVYTRDKDKQQQIIPVSSPVSATATTSIFGDDQKRMFVYLFWAVFIFVGLIIVFRFVFSAATGGDSGDAESVNTGGSLIGVVLVSLLFIFILYYLTKLNAKTTYVVTGK
jgi:hypothetical protein